MKTREQKKIEIMKKKMQNVLAILEFRLEDKMFEIEQGNQTNQIKYAQRLIGQIDLLEQLLDRNWNDRIKIAEFQERIEAVEKSNELH